MDIQCSTGNWGANVSVYSLPSISDTSWTAAWV